MPCHNCSNHNATNFAVQYFFNNQPYNCETTDCGTKTLTGRCVYYPGPNLACSGINTNDSMELALQKIDTKLCAISGSYSIYNFGCLDDGGAISSEGDFVEAVATQLCALKTSVSDITNTTIVDLGNEMNQRLGALEVPGVTCLSAGVQDIDEFSTVLGKYCTKFAAIDTALSLSGITWNNCFTVASPPTTIKGAFELVLDQICQLNSSGLGGTLPTFDNTASCLPTPGANDTLVATISKIKTRLCQSPTLDNTTLTSTCVTIPATATDLQGLMQNVLGKLDLLIAAKPTFDPADFDVTATDEQDSCAGQTIKLTTPINQDRLVAVNGADNSPGTLVDKLAFSGGLSSNLTDNPGKLTIVGGGGGADDHKVLANAADDSEGYLDQKITNGAADDGVSIVVSYNAGTKRLEIAPNVNLATLASAILSLVGNNESLRSQFCGLVSGCTSNPPAGGGGGGYISYTAEKYGCADCLLDASVTVTFPSTFTPVVGKYYKSLDGDISFSYKFTSLTPVVGSGVILSTVAYDDCASACVQPACKQYSFTASGATTVQWTDCDLNILLTADLQDGDPLTVCSSTIPVATVGALVTTGPVTSCLPPLP